MHGYFPSIDRNRTLSLSPLHTRIYHPLTVWVFFLNLGLFLLMPETPLLSSRSFGHHCGIPGMRRQSSRVERGSLLNCCNHEDSDFNCPNHLHFAVFR